MSLYEERLSADLESIRGELRAVTNDVSNALKLAIQAIRQEDRDLLYEVVLGDLEINRKIRKIDALCHGFVARHLPAAGHLRFVSSTLRMTIGLERAGDYAVTISRVVLQLNTPLDKKIVGEIAQLAEASHNMLRDAMRAFLEGNVEMAQTTRRMGKRIAIAYDQLFQSLIEESPRRPRLELASLMTIFAKLDRFSDQSKNICEETIFAVTGEAKKPKVFRILFLDDQNDFLSHLAEGIAWKGFSKRGVFSSAGWTPSEELHPKLLPTADRFGLELRRARPSLVTGLDESPIEYHLVVTINSADSEKLHEVAYHTILQRWEVAVPDPDSDESLDTCVRELTSHVNNLMEKLCGTRDD